MNLPKRKKRRAKPIVKINGVNFNDLLDDVQAAKFVGLSVSYLRNARERNTGLVGPKFVKPDGYHIRYFLRDLEAFMRQRYNNAVVVDPKNCMRRKAS